MVYFTAKWCPPCRRIGPFLAELSNETPSVAFGKVDIDDNDGAAQMAAIKSVPTFKFFKVIFFYQFCFVCCLLSQGWRNLNANRAPCTRRRLFVVFSPRVFVIYA